jgi:hypothetical protein
MPPSHPSNNVKTLTKRQKHTTDMIAKAHEAVGQITSAVTATASSAASSAKEATAKLAVKVLPDSVTERLGIGADQEESKEAQEESNAGPLVRLSDTDREQLRQLALSQSEIRFFRPSDGRAGDTLEVTIDFTLQHVLIRIRDDSNIVQAPLPVAVSAQSVPSPLDSVPSPASPESERFRARMARLRDDGSMDVSEPMIEERFRAPIPETESGIHALRLAELPQPSVPAPVDLFRLSLERLHVVAHARSESVSASVEVS